MELFVMQVGRHSAPGMRSCCTSTGAAPPQGKTLTHWILNVRREGVGLWGHGFDVVSA